MTKKTYMIIAAIIVILVAGFIWWNSMRVEEPATQETVQSVDTTESIERELTGIDVGDVSAEFKDVDQALQGL